MKKILLFLLLFLLFYFFYSNNRNNINKDFNKNKNSIKFKMSLVVPTVSKDLYKISRNFKFYKKYIVGINNLVFIGDEKVEKIIKQKQYIFKLPLNFINEKFLIDIDKLKNLIKLRKKSAIRRSGWYIQQFLKMQYSKICQDMYYLIWDSDTIPVKEVEMFNNNGKPYFDVRTEYHKPYFDTMKKIFPKLGKKYNYSFISEHMLIKTELMRTLINQININNNISGNTWFEKIINCIDLEELEYSGFSEFETYGTFVNEYYNKTYDIRPWKSLRYGKYYYNPKYLTSNDILNIAKNYDSISFEKFN